jgi:AcrR family transcriptional regulator
MTTSSIEHLPTARYRPSHDGQSTVLDATLAELADRGYAAASLRTIAERADVPLETVFDRWRSKQHLVQDAIRHLARRQPAPETGDLRSDLIQVTEALSGLLTHPGVVDVLRSLLTPPEPGVGTAPRIDLVGERRAVIRRIVERGQRRQQCPADVHPGLVADAIVGGLIYRLLISGDAVSRRTVVGLVDLVLADRA